MDVWFICMTINQPLTEVSGIWNIPCSLKCFGNVVEMRRVGTFVRGVGTCAVEVCHLSFFIMVNLLFPLCHFLADCLKLSKWQWVFVNNFLCILNSSVTRCNKLSYLSGCNLNEISAYWLTIWKKLWSDTWSSPQNMGRIGPIRTEMETGNCHVCTMGRTTWESGCDPRLR